MKFTGNQNRSSLSYKITFAAKHPDQIAPYVRRVCVDARLRAKAEDHVTYYRRIMKYKAATHSLEVAVGSRSYEQWLEFGQMQFDYLLRHGLKPADRILEIGCGNLRAGPAAHRLPRHRELLRHRHLTGHPDVGGEGARRGRPAGQTAPADDGPGPDP